LRWLWSDSRRLVETDAERLGSECAQVTGRKRIYMDISEDIFTEPDAVSDALANLEPLRHLAGI